MTNPLYSPIQPTVGAPGTWTGYTYQGGTATVPPFPPPPYSYWVYTGIANPPITPTNPAVYMWQLVVWTPAAMPPPPPPPPPPIPPPPPLVTNLITPKRARIVQDRAWRGVALPLRGDIWFAQTGPKNLWNGTQGP
jgi:hypothetical protein